MSSAGNKELAAGEDRHTTGKSMSGTMLTYSRRLRCALSVVVNAQADALSGKIIGIRKATYPLFSQR